MRTYSGLSDGKDADKDSLLIIECKTSGKVSDKKSDDFDAAWQLTISAKASSPLMTFT